MPHPIYGPPATPLRTLTFSIELPDRTNAYRGRVTAAGYTPVKRGALWVVVEEFEGAVAQCGASMCDAVNHVTAAALQDRPDTQQRIEQALRGGPHVEQDQLPF